MRSSISDCATSFHKVQTDSEIEDLIGNPLEFYRKYYLFKGLDPHIVVVEMGNSLEQPIDYHFFVFS